MDGHSTAFFKNTELSGSEEGHQDMPVLAEDDAPTSTAPGYEAWPLGEPPLLPCGSQDAATAAWRRDLTTAWALNDLLTSREFAAWLRSKKQVKVANWVALSCVSLLAALACVPLIQPMATNPYVPRIAVPACQEQPKLCYPATLLSRVPGWGPVLQHWLPDTHSNLHVQHVQVVHNQTPIVLQGESEPAANFAENTCPASSILFFSCCKECPGSWDAASGAAGQTVVSVLHQQAGNLEPPPPPHQEQPTLKRNHGASSSMVKQLAQLMDILHLQQACEQESASLVLLPAHKGQSILSCLLFGFTTSMSLNSAAQMQMPLKPMLQESSASALQDLPDAASTTPLTAIQLPPPTPTAHALLDGNDQPDAERAADHPWSSTMLSTAFLCGFLTSAVFALSVAVCTTWHIQKPAPTSVSQVSPPTEDKACALAPCTLESDARSGTNQDVDNIVNGNDNIDGTHMQSAPLQLSPVKLPIPAHFCAPREPDNAATLRGTMERKTGDEVVEYHDGEFLLDHSKAMLPRGSHDASHDGPLSPEARTAVATLSPLQHNQLGAGAPEHVFVPSTGSHGGTSDMAAAAVMTPAASCLLDSPGSQGSFTFPLTQPTPSPPPVVRQQESPLHSPSSGSRQAMSSLGGSTGSSSSSSRATRMLLMEPPPSLSASITPEPTTAGAPASRDLGLQMCASDVPLLHPIARPEADSNMAVLLPHFNNTVSSSCSSNDDHMALQCGTGARSCMGSLGSQSSDENDGFPAAHMRDALGNGAGQYITPLQSEVGGRRTDAPSICTITPAALSSTASSLPSPLQLSYSTHSGLRRTTGLVTSLFAGASGIPRLQASPISSQASNSSTTSCNLSTSRTSRLPTFRPSPTSAMQPPPWAAALLPAGAAYRAKGLGGLPALRRPACQDEEADLAALVASLPEAMPAPLSSHAAAAVTLTPDATTSTQDGVYCALHTPAASSSTVHADSVQARYTTTRAGSNMSASTSTSTTRASSVTPISMPPTAGSWGSGNTTQTGSGTSTPVWGDENATPPRPVSSLPSDAKHVDHVVVGRATVSPAVSSHLAALASTCSMLNDFQHASRCKLMEVMTILQSLVPATPAEVEALRREPEAAVQRMCTASMAALQEVDVTLKLLQTEYQQGVDWLENHVEYQLQALTACLLPSSDAHGVPAGGTPAASTAALDTAAGDTVSPRTLSSSTSSHGTSSSPDVLDDDDDQMPSNPAPSGVPRQDPGTQDSKLHKPHKKQIAPAGKLPKAPLIVHVHRASDDTRQQQDANSAAGTIPVSVDSAAASPAASHMLPMIPSRSSSSGDSSEQGGMIPAAAAAAAAAQSSSVTHSSGPGPSPSQMCTPTISSSLPCHLLATPHSDCTPAAGLYRPGATSSSSAAWTNSSCIGRLVDGHPATHSSSTGNSQGSVSSGISANVARNVVGGTSANVARNDFGGIIADVVGNGVGGDISSGASCIATCSSMVDEGSSLIDLAEAALDDVEDFLLPFSTGASDSCGSHLMAQDASRQGHTVGSMGTGSDVSSVGTGPRPRSAGHHTPEASIMHVVAGHDDIQDVDVPSTGAVFGRTASRLPPSMTSKQEAALLVCVKAGEPSAVQGSTDKVETFLGLMDEAGEQATRETCWLTGSDLDATWNGMDAPPSLSLSSSMGVSDGSNDEAADASAAEEAHVSHAIESAAGSSELAEVQSVAPGTGSASLLHVAGEHEMGELVCQHLKDAVERSAACSSSSNSSKEQHQAGSGIHMPMQCVTASPAARAEDKSGSPDSSGEESSTAAGSDEVLELATCTVALSDAYVGMWRHAAMTLPSSLSKDNDAKISAHAASEDTTFGGMPEQTNSLSLLMHVHLPRGPQQPLHCSEKLTVATFSTSCARSPMPASLDVGTPYYTLSMMGCSSGAENSSVDRSQGASSGLDSRATIVSPQAPLYRTAAGRCNHRSDGSPEVKAVLLPASSVRLPTQAAGLAYSQCAARLAGPHNSPDGFDADGMSFTAPCSAAVGWASVSPTRSTALRTHTSLPAGLLHHRTQSDVASEQQFIEELVAEFVAAAGLPHGKSATSTGSAANSSSFEQPSVTAADGRVASGVTGLSTTAADEVKLGSTSSSLNRLLQGTSRVPSGGRPLPSSVLPPLANLMHTASEPSSPITPRSSNCSSKLSAAAKSSHGSVNSPVSQMLGGASCHCFGFAPVSITDSCNAMDTSDDYDSTGTQESSPGSVGLGAACRQLGPQANSANAAAFSGCSSNGLVCASPSSNSSSGYSQTSSQLDSCVARLHGRPGSASTSSSSGGSSTSSTGSSTSSTGSSSGSSSVAMHGTPCNLAARLAAAGDTSSGTNAPAHCSSSSTVGTGSAGSHEAVLFSNGNGEEDQRDDSSDRFLAAQEAQHSSQSMSDDRVAQLCEGASSDGSTGVSMGSITCDLARRLATEEMSSSGSVSSAADIGAAIAGEGSGDFSNGSSLAVTRLSQVRHTTRSDPEYVLGDSFVSDNTENDDSIIGGRHHSSGGGGGGDGSSSGSNSMPQQSQTRSPDVGSVGGVVQGSGTGIEGSSSKASRSSPLLQAVQSSSGEEDEEARVADYGNDGPKVLWSWRKTKGSRAGNNTASASSTPAPDLTNSAA